MLHVFRYYARFNANNRTHQFWVQDNHPIALVSTLLAEVSAVTGQLSSFDPQKQSQAQALSANWNAKAYPNPFNTSFQVELDWDRVSTEEIQVELLNALGQVMQTQRREVTPGRNIFKIEMNDPTSRGFLQVILRDKSGRQVWLKVMQVRE